MAKALPTISAKLVADISGFISDFKRADNESRRSTASISNHVGKLADDIKKKFSAVNIGKSLLQGFGLGSGFAVIQQATNLVTGYFEKQAQYAKTSEESLAKQLDYARQIAALRQSDGEKLSVMEADAAELLAKINKAANAGRGRTSTMGGSFGVTTSSFDRPLSDKEKAAVDELTAQYQKLTLAIETARKAQEDRATSQVSAGSDRDQSLRIKSLTDGLKMQEAQFDSLLKTQQEANAATAQSRKEQEQLAERFRQSADPLRKYRQELEELYSVMGDLSVAEINANEGRIRGSMVDSELKDFFGDMDANGKLYQNTEKLNGAAKDLGFAFSSAFEDAVLSGQKLSGIVDGLVNDIARMMLRMGVINPIMNGVFGLTGSSALSTLWGGPRASGGMVSSGSSYLVGEKGPELFTPSGSGNITPNHKLSSGGGGDNIALTYNIGSGVTASQLMPILAMHKRDIIGTLADAKRRRTPMGAAMA